MNLRERIKARMGKPKGAAPTEVVVMWGDPVNTDAERQIRLMDPTAAALDSAAVILVESPESW
jgi:hypothetical protein